MAIMRLTVGPLPAAVYWRRRALVLGALALLVVIVSYSCGGASAPNGSGVSGQAAGGATASATASVPETGESATPTASPQPQGSAFALVTAAATAPNGQCVDAEMKVIATASSASSVAGAPLELTLKFKNIGSRTCRRDIGADVQELRISQGKALIWSSDDCNPNHGHSVRSFTSNEEAVFRLRWNGSASRDSKGAVSCGNAAPIPPAGDYQLVGRLDELTSEAFALKLT